MASEQQQEDVIEDNSSDETSSVEENESSDDEGDVVEQEEDDENSEVEEKESVTPSKPLLKGVASDLRRFADVLVRLGSEGYTLPQINYGKVLGASYTYSLIPPDQLTNVETKDCRNRVVVTVYKQRDFYNELLRIGAEGYKLYSYSSIKVGSGLYKLTILVDDEYNYRINDRFVSRI